MEYETITIVGDTSGTWEKGTAVGIRINWNLGAGSDFLGTAGAWGNRFFGATGSVSLIGTNGATFYITGVQLEVGSTATSFDYRSIGTELALCQRYFVTATMAVNTVGSINNWYWNMRASPTVTGGGAGFAVNASSAYCGGLYQTSQGSQTLLVSAEL